jgi:hypothetical protein
MHYMHTQLNKNVSAPICGLFAIDTQTVFV